MNYLKLSLLALIPCFSASAATEILIAEYQPEVDRNAARVAINATFNDTALAQWQNRGNAGTTGDGRVWHAFSRFKMDQRDLFNKIDAGSTITFTTGLIQKEKERVVDNDIGGHDVDVYLALDPDGTFVQSGALPNIFNAWDWANEFGWGYDNTVKIGTVLQSHPQATPAEIEATLLEVDSPSMNITYDITSTLKSWISDQLLTANSTIAIGLVQRQAQIVDEAGNPSFVDPNLYIHSQMVFEIANAHLTVSDDVVKGPGVFSEYNLVDNWVDTGAWMGQVYVEHYPWAYVDDLQAYVYAGGDAWVFVPNGN